MIYTREAREKRAKKIDFHHLPRPVRSRFDGRIWIRCSCSAYWRPGQTEWHAR